MTHPTTPHTITAHHTQSARLLLLAGLRGASWLTRLCSARAQRQRIRSVKSSFQTHGGGPSRKPPRRLVHMNLNGAPRKIVSYKERERNAAIDRENRRVSVAWSETMPPRIAQWRPHLGCAQLPIGADPEADIIPDFPAADEAPDLAETDALEWPRGDARQQQFQQILRKLGFTVKLKPYIQRSDGSAKGDWDVGITIDVLDAAARVDEVVLASGDGDFDLLLERVRAGGAEATAYGVPGLTAQSLIRAATRYVPIEGELLLR